jgi:hypothetical protein
MKYSGSCHCGDVAFEFDAEINQVLECNCSHCSRKGYLLTFVPAGQFRLKRGEASLATYTFNKHVIQHQFCKRCGCAPFGFGTNPQGTRMAAINARCLENFDLAGIMRVAVDGRSA